MTTCGMYNGAGKFTKELGVPAKSGVSGGLLTVIPSQGAFASFSPKINGEGNTVRGIAVLQMLSDLYLNFNLFQKDLQKKDCSRRPKQTLIQTITAANISAINGDMEELARLRTLGVALDEGDYDRRTPLHSAVSAG